jgi:hypothetical protein
MYYCTSFVKLIHSSTVGWLFKVELIYHKYVTWLQFFFVNQEQFYIVNNSFIHIPPHNREARGVTKGQQWHTSYIY